MSIRQFQTGKPSEARWPFSPAVWVDGDLLYTSGMVGRDGDGKPPAPNDMAAQAGLAAQSVLDALEAGGSDAQNIVKLTTYVTDIEAYGAARAATDVLFQAKPASTLIEIGRLAAPDMLVEIEAVAHVPGTSSAVTPARSRSAPASPGRRAPPTHPATRPACRWCSPRALPDAGPMARSTGRMIWPRRPGRLFPI